jgi:hypothetical protein
MISATDTPNVPSASETRPSIQGVELDLGDHVRGVPRRSAADEAPEVLAERLAGDGYLFIPGFFDRGEARDAAAALTRRCADDGWLDPAFPPEDRIAVPGRRTELLDQVPARTPEVAELLYGRATLGFFGRLFGEPARSYDFTWARAVTRGEGTAPHCDVVFMGRGTSRVVTMWTPWCDIPEPVGGLAVLEGSHLDHSSLDAYRSGDVDTYCENLGHEPRASHGGGGELPCDDANELRDRLRGRWLWTDYEVGDVIMFGLGTVHASLDNHSALLRLSSDSRYQPAAEPVDERWVGEHPIGHSIDAQRPFIC